MLIGTLTLAFVIKGRQYQLDLWYPFLKNTKTTRYLPLLTRPLMHKLALVKHL
jgi:hypothetical protein